jgi:hypothetical protein
MRIANPVWHSTLKCPVCEQGSALAFVICPTCATLVLRCDEDGSAFLDPRKLQSTADEAAPCPKCGKWTVGAFQPATSEQIDKQGFRGEYE